MNKIGQPERQTQNRVVHLLERYHNKRFFAYMDKFMPQWRLYKDELNQTN